MNGFFDAVRYSCWLSIGLTIIIISPFLMSRIQSSLSLFFRLNCLTMLAGTVVLNEVVFVAALVKVVISPNFVYLQLGNVVCKWYITLPMRTPQ